MLTKKLPVGIDSFEKLRKEDFYYVDKTGLIADIMQNWGEVNLFTRPRRFGKTLNMSMLKSFFEVGSDKAIFEGTKIALNQELCKTYMGKYPVVFISLKGVDGLTYEDAYERLRCIITEEASRLQFLLNSNTISDVDKYPLQMILERKDSTSEIVTSLKMLCTLLEKHYGQKVILLIDEYDVPLDKAYEHGYYMQMIDLIRAMLGAALKSNSSLFFAVLTGCLRISKESIFTGLNNLTVHSISDEIFDEYFGFTDAEVQKILADYGLKSHYEEVREWYDGYRFGGQNIYCPWDVINYCYALRVSERAQPKAYWMNTSGNGMVRKLIQKCESGTTQMEIEQLIAGETIYKTLNEQLTHNEIDDNVDNIWSLLYMTGYLTAADFPNGNLYALRIPNHEVYEIYTQQVLSWFKEKANSETEKLGALYTAFETGDTETITGYLNDQLLDAVSFYDAHESFYHGFLLALLNTCANWRVSSNRESGKGRSDIIVERKDRKIGFVVEVKNVREEEELEGACERAMKQIEEKQYAQPLRRYRVKEIRAYAIAFWDKECKVVMKQLA
jgi:hypothetical protein